MRIKPYNILIHFYKDGTHICREEYNSHFVPRVGDTMDLEFIRHRQGYTFKEQYAEVKRVHFYYSNPKATKNQAVSFNITAELLPVD